MTQSGLGEQFDKMAVTALRVKRDRDALYMALKALIEIGPEHMSPYDEDFHATCCAHETCEWCRGRAALRLADTA
jgi:hypothetical protein